MRKVKSTTDAFTQEHPNGKQPQFFYLSPIQTSDHREEPNIKLLDKYWGGHICDIAEGIVLLETYSNTKDFYKM